MRDLLESLDRIAEGPVFGERMGLRKNPPKGKWGLFMLDQDVFGERERFPALGITLGPPKEDVISKIAITGTPGAYWLYRFDSWYWDEMGPADSVRIINELIRDHYIDGVKITGKALAEFDAFIEKILDKAHDSHMSSGL